MHVHLNGNGPALRPLNAASFLEPWLAALDDDELGLLKRFLLTGGSLRDLAAYEDSSVETVRLRLDQMIAKVRLAEQAKALDAFERRLRTLVAAGEMSPSLAKTLLLAHKAAMTERTRG